MGAVKVVLGRGDEEVELGPFSQGVVFENLCMFDVASNIMIACNSNPGTWLAKYPDGLMYRTDRIFVQSVKDDDGS